MRNVRATDADRERTAQALRTAAGDGCLTVEELEARLASAYGAVTRNDLEQLVADLPVSDAPPPTAAPAAPTPLPARASRRRSLFWLWALLPWMGAVAWVHACFVTRSARYAVHAAFYAIPPVLAGVFDRGGPDESVLPNWVVALAIVFWIVNALHAWMARPTVHAHQAAAREPRAELFA